MNKNRKNGRYWKSVSYMYNIWSSKHVQNNFLILLLLLLTFICLVCTMICIYTWGVLGSLWAGRWKQNIFRLVQFFFLWQQSRDILCCWWTDVFSSTYTHTKTEVYRLWVTNITFFWFVVQFRNIWKLYVWVNNRHLSSC